MDYTKLTDEEALDILKLNDEVPDSDFAELEQYIEDPVSVLYWTDADGDFKMAVHVQGLPMETPVQVARGLYEAGYDLLAFEVNTAEPEVIECAGCGQELYEFEQSSGGYTERFWISEYGEHMYDEVEFLSDPSAPPYWNADPNGPYIACTACHHDGIVDTYHVSLREDTGEYALRGFHPQGGMTQYTTGGDCGTVVRDDWYWFSMDDRQNIWRDMGDVFPWKATEFMSAYLNIEGTLSEFIDDHDYVEVSAADVASFSQQPSMPDVAKLRHDKSARWLTGDMKRLIEVVEGWANETEPHPDFNFDHAYLIIKGKSILCHEDDADKVRLTLLEQTLSKLDRTAGVKAVRRLTEVYDFVEAVEYDEYAELELSTGDILITDWEGDHTFHPYVEPMGDHGDKHPTDILDDIAVAIGDALGVAVHHIEYDSGGDIFYPTMDAPERKPVTGQR